eukprot:9310321-Pyramimonas_sp.AAC.1
MANDCKEEFPCGARARNTTVTNVTNFVSTFNGQTTADKQDKSDEMADLMANLLNAVQRFGGLLS